MTYTITVTLVIAHAAPHAAQAAADVRAGLALSLPGVTVANVVVTPAKHPVDAAAELC